MFTYWRYTGIPPEVGNFRIFGSLWSNYKRVPILWFNISKNVDFKRCNYWWVNHRIRKDSSPTTDTPSVTSTRRQCKFWRWSSTNFRIRGRRTTTNYHNNTRIKWHQPIIDNWRPTPRQSKHRWYSKNNKIPINNTSSSSTPRASHRCFHRTSNHTTKGDSAKESINKIKRTSYETMRKSMNQRVMKKYPNIKVGERRLDRNSNQLQEIKCKGS